MKVLREFLSLAFVGFVFWLFVAAVVPIPYSSAGYSRAEIQVTQWRPLMTARYDIQAQSFLACVVGFPLAAMALRRLG